MGKEMKGCIMGIKKDEWIRSDGATEINKKRPCTQQPYHYQAWSFYFNLVVSTLPRVLLMRGKKI
jgi:hypothetical protein